MIEVIPIETPSLGDRGYLATDGAVAVVVDAQRDFDRVVQLAADRGVSITHVLETHIHNDYVTGGLALAREVGAEYLVNGADPVSFERTPVADGALIRAGDMRLRAIATPGHTFTHLSYALSTGIAGSGDAVGGTGQVLAVFTGGSLLNGSTGRTDLLGEDHKLALSRAQFASARRLATELPDDVPVCPTHGFGSFCSATPTSGPSTIGEEKRTNPALTSAEADYVRGLLAGLDAYPAYYAHMGPANLSGPGNPDLSPPRQADPAELERRVKSGEWVVDLRSRSVFAAGHLPGTLNFELGDGLVTYLGWLIPWGTPLTLIGDSAEAVAAAQRDLCRIGIDEIAAAAFGPAGQWAAGIQLATYPTADFAELAARTEQGSLVLLDVRRDSEWEDGHIGSAIHIPLHELPGRMNELPAAEIWVHCQSGYRAAIAASMLAASGRPVVGVYDDFAAAGQAGLQARVA